jgi:hypothetical protein
MSSFRIPLLGLVLALSASPGLAEAASDRSAQTDASRTTQAQLPAWEQLGAADREALVAPLRDRWNANPEQRARMMQHARRWQSLTPEQRRHARHGMKRWAHMGPEKRARVRALFGEMRNMTPEQRKALRARWKAMTPEERAAWVEAHPAAPAD